MFITYKHLLKTPLSNILVNMWEYSHSLTLYIYMLSTFKHLQSLTFATFMLNKQQKALM